MIEVRHLLQEAPALAGLHQGFLQRRRRANAVRCHLIDIVDALRHQAHGFAVAGVPDRLPGCVNALETAADIRVVLVQESGQFPGIDTGHLKVCVYIVHEQRVYDIRAVIEILLFLRHVLVRVTERRFIDEFREFGSH